MKEKYSIIRSADRFIELRQYKKAIKVYQSLIDSGEKDPSIINNLGDLQLRNGDRKDALQNFSRAAAVYSESGDALKALGICRKLLRMDPSNDATLNLILDLNQRREAVFDSRGILTDLVSAAAAEGDFSRAADLQDRLIGLGDRDPVSHVRLAEYNFKSGLEDKAAGAVHKSLDMYSSRTGDSDGWDWITEVLESRNSSEDFRKFVTGLREGYVPSPADAAALDSDAAYAGEQPPATPVDREELISPEFFEVDRSIVLDEDSLEESDDSSEIDSEGFKTGSITEEQTSLSDKTDEFPGLEEEGEESAAFSEFEGHEGEEDQEFEFNLDEGELSRSPEEFLEMLEADIQAGDDQEEEPEIEDAVTIQEMKEEYTATGEAAAVEEEFELDLDREEFNLDEEAQGIEYPEALPGDLTAPEFDLEEVAQIPAEELEPDRELPPEEPVETVDKETGIGTVPSDYDEVESALEGLFVQDGQGDDKLASITPDDVPQQEYPTDEVWRKPQGSVLSGSVPAPDPDDDPDVQMELGIAYRDMALMEDAVGKFENALRMFEEQEKIDKCVLCCQMLAECCNKLDRYRETLKWVARGLDYRKVSEEEIVNFEYESAVALEELGDYSESLRGFRRIQSIHPGFRDVESRISDMESAGH